MKKKKIIIIGVIAAAIIGGGVWYYKFNSKDTTEYVTAIAAKGELIQTVSETGAVKTATEINLNFLSTGRIRAMYADVGDLVEQGQLLAELNFDNLSIKHREAEANLNVAITNLDKTMTGATDYSIDVNRAAVNQAEAAHIRALDELEKIKLVTDEDIKQAQNKLDELLSPTNQSANNLRTPIIIAIDEKIAVGKTALDAIDRILDDADMQETFAALDSSYKTYTKDAYQKSLDFLPAAQQNLSDAKLSKTDANINLAVNSSTDFLNQVLSALNYTFDALGKTISSSKFTQAELETEKSTISGHITLVTTAISAIQTKHQSLLDTLAAAANSLESEKISAQKQISSAQSTVDARYNAWLLAQAQLDELIAPARSEDVRLAQAQVNQAQANLALILSQMEDGRIYAPISGVITKVNYKIGEVPISGQSVVSVLNEDSFEIEVDISETDIAKITTENKVAITLDAFGDIKFEGKVYFIEPAETIIQDVVYYKTKISFQPSEQYKIKSGMTANVTITTAEKQDVILIPGRAVIYKNGDGKFARILKDNQLKEVPVEIGLRGDDGTVEVISGVAEGDEVVTFIQDKK